MSMYQVKQTTRKGYIMSVSYQEADSAAEAIETAKLYHGSKGVWRAVDVNDIEDEGCAS